MKKNWIAFILMLIVVAFGVAGFMIIERWNFHNSLYMTIITISTVGFKEIRELSTMGQFFTIILILTGIGGITLAVKIFVSSFFEEHFQDQFRRRKMEKELNNFCDHYIIIGLGDMGKEVANVLLESKAKFLIIDENEDILKKFYEINSKNSNWLYITGNGMDENTLKKSNIEKAIGVVITIASDADALLTVITIKEINPKVRIITRANNEKIKNKFLKAGADNVIAPNFLIGNRIANTLLKPHLINFLDSVTNIGKANIILEEVLVPPNSKILGKHLKDLQIPAKTGFIVFAIKRTDETIQFNPGPGDSLKANDSILVVGNYDNINKLTDFINKYQ